MNLLFYGNYEDQPYLPYLKSIIGQNNCRVLTKPITTIAELEMYCKSNEITKVFFTNKILLGKLLQSNTDKSPSLDSYAGSFFKRNGIEYVAVHPIQQLITVPYGKFLTKRFISKLTNPDVWFPTVEFNWEILDATNECRIFDQYQHATIIAVDIETFKNPLSIRCVGYTAIFIDSAGSITSHSCVLAIDSDYALAILRKFNSNLTPPKVMQNGKYDASYLAIYNAPLYNWLYDTATMFHAWYSELPKDLGFLGAFFVREAMYWKDLAHTDNLHEYYLYNCRDTWTTAITALAWMMEAPEWAKQNYLMEFPVLFPSHLCEMTGIKRDAQRLLSARQEIDSRITSNQTSLNTMVGGEINVNSSPQMKRLCKILGLGKTIGGMYNEVESCDEDHLKVYSFQHPLNSRIFSKVLEIRGDRKLKSTYLRTEEDEDKKGEKGSKDFKGRVLYAIDPHGTDTGRNNSHAHHFWTGFNVQNIPRGESVKQTFISDEGFVFAEVDLEQAESRGTAHLSGDSKYIAAVSGTKDFHSINCSAFFGVQYEKIYNDLLHQVIDKFLRDLAKRVNHGVNYCMGPDVLVDTMGLEFIYKAAKLLNLNPMWGAIKIAEHLIAQFHRQYPGIENVLWPGIWNDVATTHMLVGATGWTRYCFGDVINGSKHTKNSYAAHPPQSLSAMGLNKAFVRVFKEIAMHPEYGKHFKLLAQIHDSIFFQFRIGHEYLCVMVKKIMEEENTFTVKGYDGVVRSFTVPAAIKAGPNNAGVRYWSECE